MKILIVGTRGIPNNYGGFEQFAEYLSLSLKKRGHDVIVYNSHNHPYQSKVWNGVKIIHKFDPEYKLGTTGQFIYDFNCIRDLKNHNAQIILQLGYTSSSVWWWLLPGKPIVITNMDGLEWKRTKFSKKVQNFLKFAESLAAKHSDYLVADSVGIQNHLKLTYDLESTYIPYGTDLFEDPMSLVLEKYNLTEYNYDLLIARLEPENNIETILQGFSDSGVDRPFLVIGNHETKYGNYLKEKFTDEKIKFLGGIYEKDTLNNLRYYSNIYFHGHSVGGTNPSLLEAMASNALICANNNEFNKYILDDDAYYFDNSDDVKDICIGLKKTQDQSVKTQANIQKVKEIYNHDTIADQYLELFERALAQSQS